MEEVASGAPRPFIKHLKEVIERVERFRIGIMNLQTNEERLNAMISFNNMLKHIALKDEREEVDKVAESGKVAYGT